MKKRKYIFKMTICLLVLTLGVATALGQQVSASGIEAVKSNIDAFNGLEGDYQYIQNQYFDCYTLDMEETGVLESGYALFNGTANVLFTIIKWLAKATTAIFYFCMDFDVANLFKDALNDIQTALHASVFEPLFVLGFCCTGIILLKKFLKHDMAGAYGQMARVLLLVILSVLIVNDSSAVLSAATSLTKSISTQALTGINGGQDTGSFAAQSAGVLWVSLVHQPWVTIQFGNDDVTGEQIEAFMNPTNADGSEGREQLVKSYTGTAFSMKRGGGKAGFMLVYLFPFLLKCIIYIAVSVIQLLFQFIAVFWTILAPIILVVTMIPGYEGLLGEWVRKLLESQFSILVITFMMGLLIKFDELLFGWSKEWGWIPVIIIQVCVAIGAVLKRNAILGALSKVQKGVSTPAYTMAAMRRGGDGYAMASGAAKDMKRLAKSKPVRFAKESVLQAGKMAAASISNIMAANNTLDGMSVHIDAETGEWISRPVFEDKQAKKVQRADERWKKKVDTYGSSATNRSNGRAEPRIKKEGTSHIEPGVHKEQRQLDSDKTIKRQLMDRTVADNNPKIVRFANVNSAAVPVLVNGTTSEGKSRLVFEEPHNEKRQQTDEKQKNRKFFKGDYREESQIASAKISKPKIEKEIAKKTLKPVRVVKDSVDEVTTRPVFKEKRVEVTQEPEGKQQTKEDNTGSFNRIKNDGRTEPRVKKESTLETFEQTTPNVLEASTPQIRPRLDNGKRNTNTSKNEQRKASTAVRAGAENTPKRPTSTESKIPAQTKTENKTVPKISGQEKGLDRKVNIPERKRAGTESSVRIPTSKRGDKS